jgi:aryl-alcohol dehydrogenase-like predicted oxidoreductase
VNLRKLGNSGLEISPLVFGGNVIGWTADEQTSFKLLSAFAAAGFNAIDTADTYSRWAPGHTGGESEAIIGKWMKQQGNRDKVIVATKVGMDMGPAGKGLSRAHILRSAENSLNRLQTDYIDLYQSHTDDTSVPFEETLGTYAELIKQGEVRAIGASNYSAKRLAEAIAVSKINGLPRYESLQPKYSLVERADYEVELEPLCLKENVGVINYFPLAAGFLTGKYRSEADLSKSPRGQGIKKFLNDRGRKILNALDLAAAAHKVTPAAVALAWLLARASITAPIVSATSLEQLNDLLPAATLKLDSTSIEALNQASA